MNGEKLPALRLVGTRLIKIVDKTKRYFDHRILTSPAPGATINIKMKFKENIMSNIIMNIDQKLPREAYVALQALKDQASSVSSDDFIVDKEELKAAQSKMSEVDSWTKAIYRKLIASKGAVTIDDIDSSWLESQFI